MPVSKLRVALEPSQKADWPRKFEFHVARTLMQRWSALCRRRDEMPSKREVSRFAFFDWS